MAVVNSENRPDATIEPILNFLKHRFDYSLHPTIPLRRLAKLDWSAGALGVADIVNERRLPIKPVGRSSLLAALQRQFRNTFKDPEVAGAFAYQIARGADKRFYYERFEEENLASWLNYPLASRRENSSVDLSSQLGRPELYGDFASYAYLGRPDTRLFKFHRTIATAMCLSLISDRVLIIETDFTHRRNMVLKYLVRPFELRAVRRPMMRAGDDIYFSSRLLERLRRGHTAGFATTLPQLFSGDIGSFKFDADRDFGPLPQFGFYYLAHNKDDYQTCYAFPLYHDIQKGANVLEKIEALFKLASQGLDTEAQSRLAVNKQRSIARHTISVQLGILERNFETVFNQRTRILASYEGDKEALNFNLAESYGALKTIVSDVQVQFENAFDAYGDPVGIAHSPSPRAEDVPLTQLRTILEGVFKAAPTSGNRPPLAFDAGGTGLVAVPDRERFLQAFREFFTNAIKYSPAGEPVRVRVRTASGQVTITVSNVGPELSPAEAERVPAMGLRGLTAQRHTGQGTGQGLASAINVLEELGLEASYRQAPLAKSHPVQPSNRSRTGTPLASHIVEVKLPLNQS